VTRFLLALMLVLPAQHLWANEESDLAQDLANPLAAIISVPLQYNYDSNIGVDDAGSRTTVNMQPIVPFSLGDTSTLITRMIIPYVSQKDVISGTSQSGLGDILFSAWWSPNSSNGVTWGVGPIVRIPSFSDVSTDTWAAGSRRWG